MVKKNDAPKGPKIVRGEPAKKVPAKKAGAASRAAMSDDEIATGKVPMTSEQALAANKGLSGEPKEGDTRHDEVNNIDLVYRNGRWIPAAGQKFTGGTADMDLEAPPAASGWGSGIDVTAANEADDPDPPPDSKVGWGLDGQQQIVDEEGADASEAGKVAQSRKSKEPKAKPKGDTAEGVNLTGMSKDLIEIVERAERVNEEISVLKEDLGEIIAEAKQKGYSTKILREAIRRRAMDPDKRKEHDNLLALYEEALRGL